MIRSQLRVLIGQKSQRERRRITYRDIEAATQVKASTISRMAQDKMNRFEAATLEALCRYFECDVGDILMYQPNEEVTISNKLRNT